VQHRATESDLESGVIYQERVQQDGRTAMLQLATNVPAAVLADLLGIATTTAADWAHAAGGDWSGYAAQIARTRIRPAADDAEAAQ
jgi:hypothetical protein